VHFFSGHTLMGILMTLQVLPIGVLSHYRAKQIFR